MGDTEGDIKSLSSSARPGHSQRQSEGRPGSPRRSAPAQTGAAHAGLAHQQSGPAGRCGPWDTQRAAPAGRHLAPCICPVGPCMHHCTLSWPSVQRRHAAYHANCTQEALETCISAHTLRNHRSGAPSLTTQSILVNMQRGHFCLEQVAEQDSAPVAIAEAHKLRHYQGAVEQHRQGKRRHHLQGTPKSRQCCLRRCVRQCRVPKTPCVVLKHLQAALACAATIAS